MVFDLAFFDYSFISVFEKPREMLLEFCRVL
jgi:hypothetical protein